MKKMISIAVLGVLFNTSLVFGLDFDPLRFNDSEVEYLKTSKVKNQKIRKFNSSLALYIILAKQKHEKTYKAKGKMCKYWNELSMEEKKTAINQNHNMYLFDEEDLDALDGTCL